MERKMKKINRLLSFCAAVMMTANGSAFFLSPGGAVASAAGQGFSVAAETSAPATSGTCGTNLKWEVQDSGVLRIYGTGAMNDYSVKVTPWSYVSERIKEIRIEEGVTTISASAFDDLSEAKSATIPSTVTKIGDLAFANRSLMNIDFPDTPIDFGGRVFSNSAWLSEQSARYPYVIVNGSLIAVSEKPDVLSVPEGVTQIAGNAFRRYEGKKVILPEGVTSIGSQAFRDSDITEIYIPASVKEIAEDAFYGCDGLKTIAVNSKNKNYCAVDNVLMTKDKGTLLQYPAGSEATDYSVPEGVTRLGNCAFLGTENLETVSLPDSLTTIEENTFYMGSVKSITIPPRVKTVPTYTFVNSDLETITFESMDGSFSYGGYTYLTKLKIYGYQDSAIQKLAAEKDLPFTVMNLRGDVNVDGAVDEADADLLSRVVGEDRTAVITSRGKRNADVDDSGNPGICCAGTGLYARRRTNFGLSRTEQCNVPDLSHEYKGNGKLYHLSDSQSHRYIISYNSAGR